MRLGPEASVALDGKADHFFSTHIDELTSNVEDYLDKHLSPPKRKTGRTREQKEAAR